MRNVVLNYNVEFITNWRLNAAHRPPPPPPISGSWYWISCLLWRFTAIPLNRFRSGKYLALTNKKDAI